LIALIQYICDARLEVGLESIALLPDIADDMRKVVRKGGAMQLLVPPPQCK
jgi:hypothetical protein